MGLPPASSRRTAGCTKNGAPLVAAADGCVVMCSSASGPTTNEIVGVTSGVNPGAVMVTVADPAAPTNAGRLNVTMPTLSLVAEIAAGVEPPCESVAVAVA